MAQSVKGAASQKHLGATCVRDDTQNTEDWSMFLKGQGNSLGGFLERNSK